MSILDDIKAYKLQDLALRKQAIPRGDLEDMARATDPPRGFEAALGRACAQGYGLIAEIKKASPSKGLIRADFDPTAHARAYAAGGAACLSVLTDTPSFQGADAHLGQARAAVDLPVLRKDFLYDPWQVIQSRAIGADCVLIILASVSDAQAAEIEATAIDWGMDVLIEVHDEAELDRAAGLRSALLGINNRDLNTFGTDVATTTTLARKAPRDRRIVSESGLATREDLARIAACGVRAFLIGETLMRAPDIETATRDLLRDPFRTEAA